MGFSGSTPSGLVGCAPESLSSAVPGLIGVCDPDRVNWDVDHAGVFYFVNGVTANVGHLSALGDQHNVVALQETHKP